MAIPEHLIAEVRDRADIAEIIGQYVLLRQRGKNHVGLCPFHSEKTPSFNVNRELGIYKCFGCGRSGDVFTFLREYVGMTFIEAVRTVAERVGIPLPNDESGNSAAFNEHRQLVEILSNATAFYRNQLQQSKTAQSFIRKRGIETSMVERFQIGYAPQQWTAVGDYLRERGISLETIERAGLIIIRDDGRFFDRFRHRLMFPIWNSSGEIIAFGGRRLSDDPNEPKYINSPQTLLYDKSAVLYGLNFAKHAITRHRSTVIAEGYLDTIALHFAGIENAVAPCGAALTERHLEALRRYCDRVILVFDGDPAGMNAAQRAVILALSKGFAPDVVMLPEGQDPDSIVHTRGADALRQLLNKQLSPVEFLLTWSKNQQDWSNPHVAKTQIRQLLQHLVPIPDPLYRELLLRELSDRVGIRSSLLEWMLSAGAGTAPRRDPVPAQVKQPPVVGGSIPRPALPIFPEEATLLQVILYSRTACDILFDEYLFDPASLLTENARRLIEVISQHRTIITGDRPIGADLPRLELDDELRELAEWLVFTHQMPSDKWLDDTDDHHETFYRRLLDDALEKLEDRRLEQRIADLRSQLEHEPENVEILQQIERLHKLRIQLRNRNR
ncbi:MAG: DNA primase [Chlorobi bacterium]|nr:DNA primase [Chlorobiota bacterium]